MSFFNFLRKKEKSNKKPSSTEIKEIEYLLSDDILNEKAALCATYLRWALLDSNSNFVEMFDKTKCKDGIEYINWCLTRNLENDYPEHAKLMKIASYRFIKKVQIKLFIRK